MADDGEIRIGFEVDTSGIDVLKEALASAVRVADMEVAKALLADSRAYVPVLTGALLDSGRIEELPELSDTLHIVRVVYGRGADLVYAKKQHDEVYNHPQLGFRGRALFLKKPFELNYLFYMELHRITLERELAGLGF